MTIESNPSRILATAADSAYGVSVINLVGSVIGKSDIFDTIIVYDLGLTRAQRVVLSSLPGVELRAPAAFAPHWKACWSWKPWIWTHCGGDIVLYLDAGCAILQSLDPVLEEIATWGYFVVSQKTSMKAVIPSTYYSYYSLPLDIGEKECVAAGIIGFDRRGEFYDRVIAPTYRDVLLGRNLGWSQAEVHRGEVPIHRLPNLTIRDCELFRHDQTLLNLRLYSEICRPRVGDAFKFAGWLTAYDHPEQVIWNHRRQTFSRDFVSLPGSHLVKVLAWFISTVPRAKKWLNEKRPYLRPKTYTRKLTYRWRRTDGV